MISPWNQSLDTIPTKTSKNLAPLAGNIGPNLTDSCKQTNKGQGQQKLLPFEKIGKVFENYDQVFVTGVFLSSNCFQAIKFLRSIQVMGVSEGYQRYFLSSAGLGGNFSPNALKKAMANVSKGTRRFDVSICFPFSTRP
jgi:hypothetical protein